MNENVNAVLDSLNEEQRSAVECMQGPVLIVAGAGSGKTRVLTSRIAHILASGVDASRVLALTFTKKAATEMKERIAAMVGPKRASRLVMGTFHSVFIRFLREYASTLGYTPTFTIYDTSDSQSAVKTCLKELGLDEKQYKPKDILSRISMAKNNLITVSAYRSSREAMETDVKCKRPRFADVYELYQRKLKQSSVMDFDDILLNMNYLLKDNPEALQNISSRFSYIMVDEYQDTNRSQYLILKQLARFHRNICVVGDDSQSIYAFRGAKIENILNFRKDYPECKVFRLERNYRSTTTIVQAANSLIAHNSNRIPKDCYAVGEQGEKIKVIKSYSEQDEAIRVVSDIVDRMRQDKCQYQDFALLYRTNAQSRVLEEQLRRRNIPYMIYSGNSFFDRAEVKDMMAYFKLCVNPSDNESFRRVVNKPARGIGGVTIQAVEAIAAQKGLCLLQAALEVPKVKTFSEMILSLSSLVPTTDAHDLAQRIATDSQLWAFYKSDNSMEGQARAANVEELLNSVAAFVEDRRDEASEELPSDAVFTLDDYLENVSLLSNADVSEEDSANRVALMTVHSSKGLEFPYVYICGLEENLFPSSSMLSSLADIEEERRLFYVAVTRAQKAVGLSFAATRMRNGSHESNSPSRFIKEIDPKYLDKPLQAEDFGNEGVRHEWGGFGSRYTGGRIDRVERTGMEGRREWAGRTPVRAVSTPKPNVGKPSVVDPNFEGVPMNQLYKGQRIEHNRFGAGVILNISGTEPDLKAQIRFDDYGEKLLLLKYAKIRPLK